MQEDNNRMDERYDCQLPVKVCSSKEPDNYHYGFAYNYSKGGIHIKTDKKLNPDSYYCIEIIDYGSEEKYFKKHQTLDSRLRWSKRAETCSKSESGYSYGCGFEYLSPIAC